MSTQQELSTILSSELLKFFNAHSPATFNSKLRSIILDYYDWKIQNDNIPSFCEDFLWTLNDFLDILEIAAKEFNDT
jgi:hypothetical protein